MKVILTLAFTFGLYVQLNCQPSCYPVYNSIYYLVQTPTSLPPLNTGMTFDELIGHIALDSICRNVDPLQIDSFISRRTFWDDSLKAITKYLVTLDDINPLTIFSITNSSVLGRRSFPSDIRSSLLKPIRQFSTSPGIDEAIVSSDFIMSITVVDTSTYTDTSARFARTAKIATAAIDSILLGHAFPLCALALPSFSST